MAVMKDGAPVGDEVPDAQALRERHEKYRQEVLETAQDLVDACELLGLVLTVEQVAVPPLAMGHYRTVCSVRLKRELQQLVD